MATATSKIDATVRHYESRGWAQSHSTTDRGCIFERFDDSILIVMAVDANGNIISECRLDNFAVKSGVASVVVQKLYQAINS